MYILGYDCITAAGANVDQLMQALYIGRDCSQPSTFGQGRICSIDSIKKPSYQAGLQGHFNLLWDRIYNGLSPELQSEISKSRIGFVLSSTKGFIEDYIWSSTATDIRQQSDPFNALVDNFCQTHSEIPWSLSCNVSNACSSSHIAIEYVQDLFVSSRLDYAFVIAADLIGPFVFKGFNSLKLISPTRNRPFSGDRDGLQLGEAAVLVLLSRERKSLDSVKVLSVASDTEGSSITRPSVNGQGLVRAMISLEAQSTVAPDVVIAHGTGTRFNDQAEDIALYQFLGESNSGDIPVTNTKWCIGHTLGASGVIDLISACEILKRQKIFSIQNTLQKDNELKMKYLTANCSQDPQKKIQQVLVTSLGFGGVHAAMTVAIEEGKC